MILNKIKSKLFTPEDKRFVITKFRPTATITPYIALAIDVIEHRTWFEEFVLFWKKKVNKKQILLRDDSFGTVSTFTSYNTALDFAQNYCRTWYLNSNLIYEKYGNL